MNSKSSMKKVSRTHSTLRSETKFSQIKQIISHCSIVWFGHGKLLEWPEWQNWTNVEVDGNYFPENRIDHSYFTLCDYDFDQLFCEQSKQWIIQFADIDLVRINLMTFNAPILWCFVFYIRQGYHSIGTHHLAIWWLLVSNTYCFSVSFQCSFPICVSHLAQAGCLTPTSMKLFVNWMYWAMVHKQMAKTPQSIIVTCVQYSVMSFKRFRKLKSSVQPEDQTRFLKLIRPKLNVFQICSRIQ